jgi:hypothetical protein
VSFKVTVNVSVAEAPLSATLKPLIALAWFCRTDAEVGPATVGGPVTVTPSEAGVATPPLLSLAVMAIGSGPDVALLSLKEASAASTCASVPARVSVVVP